MPTVQSPAKSANDALIPARSDGAVSWLTLAVTSVWEVKLRAIRAFASQFTPAHGEKVRL